MTYKVKIGTLLGMTLIVMMILGGCAESSLESYRAASKITDAVSSGVQTTDFHLNYTFDKTALKETKIKQLENFEELSLKLTDTFNKKLDQFAIDGYLSMGGLGFDGAVYKSEKGIYAYLPLVNRFVHFEEMMASKEFKDLAKDQQMAPPISAETLLKLDIVWQDLLTAENVFKGSPTLVETGEGELKATLYEITLTPEQISTGLKQVLSVLREDEKWVLYINEQLSGAGEDMTVEQLLEDKSWNALLSSGIDFKYTAYVDKDGYILKEKVAVDTDMNQTDNPLKNVQFTMETTLEKRDAVETIEIPDFNDDNTIRPAELKKWMDGYKSQ